MVKLDLYSKKLNSVGTKSGLNWCHSKAHVTAYDAYIAVYTEFFKNHDSFFPDHGSIINVIWDDGFQMQCLLEGTQPIGDKIKFKQIASYGDKSILGCYLRKRLGVSANKIITLEDLFKYGRTDISVEKMDNDNYLFDFSV